MYGETSVSSRRSRIRCGLSPHVRGNQARGGRKIGSDGSIPACTGKPQPPRRAPHRSMVYPRMYGETFRRRKAPVTEEGLSPHVRGNQSPIIERTQWARSIPACTGKPVPPAAGANPPEVYPRMYGETSAVYNRPGSSSGLSPHVRGTFPRYGFRGRIGGLSPHVRGNPGKAFCRLPNIRSIPACTGKPDPRDWGGDCAQVYPRMYGETSIGPVARAGWPGLSPHVRGNQRSRALLRCHLRSIPACTGKPTAAGSSAARARVYPRMYGETSWKKEERRCCRGVQRQSR